MKKMKRILSSEGMVSLNSAYLGFKVRRLLGSEYFQDLRSRLKKDNVKDFIQIFNWKLDSPNWFIGLYSQKVTEVMADSLNYLKKQLNKSVERKPLASSLKVMVKPGHKTALAFNAKIN